MKNRPNRSKSISKDGCKRVNCPKTYGYCCPIQCACIANLEIRVLVTGFSCTKFIERRISMPAAVALPSEDETMPLVRCIRRCKPIFEKIIQPLIYKILNSSKNSEIGKVIITSFPHGSFNSKTQWEKWNELVMSPPYHGKVEAAFRRIKRTASIAKLQG